MQIAHLSDLHLGLSAANDAAAADLVEALLDDGVDLAVVSGDVTHRGRRAELETFHRLFRPLADRLVVVPGNHDRLGDDLGDALMPGFRVQAALRAGAWVVRFNSTGPHNRRWLDGHGLLTAVDLADCEAALRAAPRGVPRLLVMHHHPLPLPDEHLMEKLVTRLGWPNARELALGSELVGRLRCSCEALLHGHRHIPAEHAARGPLRVLSGGSSTQRRGYRLLRWDGFAFSARWRDASGAPSLPSPSEPGLRRHRRTRQRGPSRGDAFVLS